MSFVFLFALSIIRFASGGLVHFLMKLNMNIIELNTLNFNEVVDKSIDILKSGGLIIYPTETAYGLGADIYNKNAVERVYNIKQRHKNLPLSVIVGNIKIAESICSGMNNSIKSIIGHFMPGPLTLVYKADKNVPEYVLGGGNSIGFRIPGNDYCLELLKKYKKPVTATSANFSGKSEARKIADIGNEVLDNAELVIDSGEIKSEDVSTIIKIKGNNFEIVREGAIKKEEIFIFLKELNIL